MTDKDAIMIAYGILWRDANASGKSNAARGVLRDRLTVEERRRGLRRATDLYGDVSDSEALLMEEMK